MELGEHELPDDATECAQTLDTHVRELTRTMKTESLKGSVHDRNKRSRRKYGSKDTVTVGRGRTEEEADCMAVQFGRRLYLWICVSTTDLI
jgi:hypothetical protein